MTSHLNKLSYPDQSFFNQLNQASHRLLLLDYDGTLSPFVEDRFKAYPYPGITDLLAKLIACPDTRVVIITGRPLNEIVPLLQMSPTPEIWGSHGWQRLTPDGTAEDFPMPDEIKKILDKVRQGFEEKIPKEKLDIKPSSVAVHWRGLDEDKQRSFSDHAKAICAPYQDHSQVELQAFDGGLELRVKGRDKGTSVMSLLNESPQDTLAVFLGDDRTDEDAFHALGEQGYGLLVRKEFRETEAKYWLKPPEELLTFLNAWYEVCK